MSKGNKKETKQNPDLQRLPTRFPPVSRSDFLRTLKALAIASLLASCKPKTLDDLTEAATATPKPTDTLTPSPTLTHTPEPTATNTPEPILPPQHLADFVNKLEGEFTVVWNQDENTWDLKENLALKVTETETETKEVSVAKFNEDGTEITVNVKGEEKHYPVSNFGLTDDLKSPESQNRRLVGGESVNNGIGYKMGLKFEGRDELGYNVWGRWVENRDYRVGNLTVNDFRMFAGALSVNPEKADYIYEGIVGGLYNIQVVSENWGILNRFPTKEDFIKAAREGFEFSDLNVPVDYPSNKPPNVFNDYGTIVKKDKLKLETIKIGFEEQNRDGILHPKRNFNSFFSYHYNTTDGSLASVAISVADNDGEEMLSYNFVRPTVLAPRNYYKPFLVESPQDWIRESANQILELWIYSSEKISDKDPWDVYRESSLASPTIPVLWMREPSINENAMKSYYSKWQESEIIQISTN